MFYNKILYSAIIMLVCHNTFAQRTVETSLKNSSWLQEGYGRALHIGDSTYTYYNINNSDCSSFVDGNFGGRFSVVSLTGKLLVLNPGGIVNYRFKRIDSLPPICTGSTTPKVTSFEASFRVFWNTFNDNYAFFQRRKVDWQQVYNEYLPVVKRLKTEKEFGSVLREIVKEIDDGHIRLEIPDSLSPNNLKVTPKAVKNKKDLIADLQKDYINGSRSYNNGLIRWGFLKNSKIGYIVLTDMNNFSNYVTEADRNSKDFNRRYELKRESKSPLEQFNDEIQGVEKAMQIVQTDLRESQALVIDLRFNGGGYETVALKLLSYFVSHKEHILSIKAKTADGFTPDQPYVLVPNKDPYRKKVYLLLGPNTASAAEIFALGTLRYPNITRIGSKTAGIFSELLWKELPNGWGFSLSNEIYTDGKGKSYEGVGIPVNYELNYPRDRSTFYDSFYQHGTFLDKALEKVYKLEK